MAMKILHLFAVSVSVKVRLEGRRKANWVPNIASRWDPSNEISEGRHYKVECKVNKDKINYALDRNDTAAMRRRIFAFSIWLMFVDIMLGTLIELNFCK